MNQSKITVDIGRVRSVLQQHLTQSGYTDADAAIIGEEFIENEILGEPYQGLALFKQILDEERLKKKSTPIIKDFASITICDAGGGFVHPILESLLNLSVKAAKENGLHLLALKNNTCFIKAAYPVRRLLAHNLIGVCLVYVNYKCGASSPIGEPIFGTNPIAIGVPAGGEFFVFDSATTAASWNKLKRLTKHGEVQSEFPLGLNREGISTFIFESLTAILPFGGNRGLGLLMAVEMLAGSLLGFPVGTQKLENDNSGILILALDPEKFGPLEGFQMRNEMLISSLRTLSRGAAYIPGEKYLRLYSSGNEIEITVELARTLGI